MSVFRSDGVYSKPMFLPSKIPFYLYRGTHGCQAVSGMRVQEQMLSFYDSINASGYVPYMDTSTGADGATKYTLHLCYYTTLT